MASQVNGESEASCAPNAGSAAPPTLFPLFDPQKRKEMMQQKALACKPKKSRGGRAATPTSLSDNESATITTTTTAEKKSQSRSSTKGMKPRRRLKNDPDGDFSASKPWSRKKSPPNTEPVTPFLTPTSSPPTFDNINDLADIDLNRSRRKRRKKTPVPPQDDCLPDAAMSEVLPAEPLEPSEVPSSPVITHAESPAVAQPPDISVQPPPKADAFGVLMAKKRGKEREEVDEEPTVDEEDEPMLPSAPLPEGTTLRRRIPVSYDYETGMLIIRSSPNLLPTSPNLGPITTLDLPGNNEMQEEKKLSESAETATTNPRKRTTTKYDSKTGIFIIKSSPILGPQGLDLEPVPPSSFSLMEHEDLPPMPSSPVLMQDSVETSAEAGAQSTGKRTAARFDAETGHLIISSPILGPILAPKPAEPRPKSAFSILGKKKEPPPSAASAAPSQAAPAQAALPTVTIRQAPKKGAGSQPSKTVHPFFKPGGLKKVQDVNPLPAKSDTEEDIVALDSQPNHQPARNMFGASSVTSSSGMRTSLGSNVTLGTASNQGHKFAAVRDAPWPNQVNSHVRGLPVPPVGGPVIMGNASLLPTHQKRKERAVAVSGEEDLLFQFARKLSISKVVKSIGAPDYYQRRYYDVPSDIRLPERIVTTGSDLQGMVRRRLSARIPRPNALSNGDGDSRCGKVHPALLKLYKRLREELTPFDKSECETSSWEVKYAPESSSEVLQTGKEAQVLKDWLLALKVESTGPSSDKKSSKRKSKNPGSSGAGGKGTANKKRKKKKESELSDFVVDSEEERDEMNEISDPEDSGTSAGVFGVKKSTIRAGDKGIDCPFGGPKEPTRLVNAVVISGPNGCGKTAAVYAVAKEAGFTVFELSPGMRRNGKDIIDHVGEMSKTHLVHQAKAAAPSDGGANFFKPKQALKVKTEEEGAAAKTGPSQQQSLILIEEADLIFEEDKQFWTSIQTLMAQSKRPIVFTCNDESLIPFNTLSLHAVLRFTPPPRDLVIDNLLLMCANEGHLLQRGSVESLVVSHRGDMRASLVELEFWCRMGLGDRRGGLDWMIMRWPEGIDIAENGEKLRVISEDSYLKGMGDFPRAPMAEDEKWRDIWENWEVDVGYEGMEAKRLEELYRQPAGAPMKNLLDPLRICEEYADALSGVDVYAGAAMRGFDDLFMDSTQPELSLKARADDIQGHPMLQEDPLDHLHTVETELAVTVRYLAKRHLYGSKYHEFQDQELVDLITRRSLNKQQLAPLSNEYLASTFRPLSHAATLFASTPAICHSAINRTPALLMLDVAPYVRSIVRHDAEQAEMRIRASNLLSAGGGRLTRTARNAGEGGDRARKDRWLPDLNVELVKRSGGDKWGNLDENGDLDGEYELEFEE